jgi:biopolymer transport protein ExbD
MGGGSGSGRRKSLDAEINLVSFIDLLSMCICFLLITAVWVQIGSMQVKQSHGTEGAAMSAHDYEMELKFSGPHALAVAVKRGGRAVKSVKIAEPSSEAMLSKLDASVRGLATSLRKGKTTQPLFSAAMLTPTHGVSYGDMVSVMDVLRRNQITNLGVVPVRE